MLPDRSGVVKVRASFAGEAEILVVKGQHVLPGQTLAVVEGEREIERLAVKNGGLVVDTPVKSGTDVEKDTVLLQVQEAPQN